MRTTLTIDDDLLRISRSLAEQRHVSTGVIVSELIRLGLKKRVEYSMDSELPVFEVKESHQIITLEDVKKAEDE